MEYTKRVLPLFYVFGVAAVAVGGMSVFVGKDRDGERVGS